MPAAGRGRRHRIEGVPLSSLLQAARDRWVHLAGGRVTFRDNALDIATALHSQLCPPDWLGIVVLGNAAIATTPEPERVRQALDGLPIAALTDPEIIAARLPIADILGPAILAYTETAPPTEPVEQLPPDHADVKRLIDTVPPDEAGEAAIDDLTSPAFIVRAADKRDNQQVVAVAGYELWPYATAHLSVLTAPTHRGRGLARITAAAAVRHALAHDLLPQWRARPAASRRVATALGFHDLGAQLSLKLRNRPT